MNNFYIALSIIIALFVLAMLSNFLTKEKFDDSNPYNSKHHTVRKQAINAGQTGITNALAGFQ